MTEPSSNRSAFTVALLAMGGRFITFIGRTMYIGKFGAAHPLLNVFTYALHVPNVLFTIAGTALTTVMIPIYNTLLAEDKPAEAKKFIDNVISIVMVLLMAVVAVALLGAPLMARVVGGADFAETTYLTFSLRVLMPVMLFFGFGAIFSGLLQSHGVFRLPALVSAPGGVLLIVYVLFFAGRFGVTGLLYVTALGVLMQPLLLLPAVVKLGYRYRFTLDLKNKDVRAAGWLCVPVLVSVISYQIHFLFAHAMALQLGTAAILDYAQQLVQVFILILVFAVTVVYFPKLSSLWAKDDRAGYNENLSDALVYALFWVLPAACGFLLLRFEIMEFLLNWSGTEDVELAGNLMGLYAIAIVAVSIREIADRGFYATKDAKTPAIFGVMIMAFNIGLIILLLPRLGTFAMPVAYGAVMFTAAAGLLIRLHRKTGFIKRAAVWSLMKIIFCVAVMATVVWAVRWVNPFDHAFVQALLPALAGAAAYLIPAHILVKLPRNKLTARKREETE